PLLGVCAASTPVAVPAARLPGDAAAGASAAPGVTALTWNVYVGAEIERVVQAGSPEEAIQIATEQWANVQATNFPARAGALAAAIAGRRPQLVGLEELALYRTTDKPFEELASRVAYDFLQLVLDSLHARGLDYTAAAVNRTTDIQVPVIAGFDASGLPILVGDFNSDVYGADPTRATPTYGMVLRAGFADSWKAPDREAPGLTCCERADLLNPQQTFDQRIDFVFTRNLPDGAVPLHREVV